MGEAQRTHACDGRIHSALARGGDIFWAFEARERRGLVSTDGYRERVVEFPLEITGETEIVYERENLVTLHREFLVWTVLRSGSVVISEGLRIFEEGRD